MEDGQHGFTERKAGAHVNSYLCQGEHATEGELGFFASFGVPDSQESLVSTITLSATARVSSRQKKQIENTERRSENKMRQYT